MTEDQKRTPPAEPQRDKLGRRKPTGRPPGSKNNPNLTTVRKVSRALALRAKGATEKELSKALDITPGAVHRALAPFDEILKKLPDLGQYRSARNDLLDGAEMVVLREVFKSEKLEAASLRDVAQALEKIVKANRLYHGQSSENISASVAFFDRSDEDR
jgi:hypothetical protein